MTSSTKSTLVFTAVAAAASVLAPAARAADDDAVKASCMQTSEQAQKLRLDGQLLGARPLFASCSRAECPTIVRQDCAQWLGEAIHDTPSIVLAARDDEHRDLVDVHVTMDDRDLAQSLDGKTLEIDPGVHRFRFAASGYDTSEVQIVVRTGEKMREVAVVMPRTDWPAATPPEQPAAAPDTGAPRGGSHNLAYLLGGLGVVALGSALVLDITATSDAHDLRSTCAPTCSASDVDWVRARYDMAVGALAIGVVSVGLAAYLFTRPSPAPASAGGAAASSFFVGLAPRPRGVEGAFGARF